MSVFTHELNTVYCISYALLNGTRILAIIVLARLCIVRKNSYMSQLEIYISSELTLYHFHILIIGGSNKILVVIIISSRANILNSNHSCLSSPALDRKKKRCGYMRQLKVPLFIVMGFVERFII